MRKRERERVDERFRKRSRGPDIITQVLSNQSGFKRFWSRLAIRIII